MQILSCFATALGFQSDFFTTRHDISSIDALTTLRLLYYPDIQENPIQEGHWRSGMHTDFDCLTLVFQKTGQDGLEVLSGRKSNTSLGHGDKWIPVTAKTGEIVCNVGDMMMMWSGDRMKSLYHRVRPPADGESTKGRYSIAYEYFPVFFPTTTLHTRSDI